MQMNSIHNEVRRFDYWLHHHSDQPIKLDNLNLLPSSNQARIDDTQVFLKPKEFCLLHFLMTHPDVIHTRDQLRKQIWGDGIIVENRTVDVHISRLRKTLRPFGLDKLVQTVSCRGYLLGRQGARFSVHAET